jgi:phage gpG-like protein
MISGYLVGDKAMIARFQAMPAAVKSALDDEVQKLGYALQLRVQRDYLRGPRPTRLGVKTGRLLRSITQGGSDSRSRFESTATTSYAYVGTNVEYGAPWEYGFAKRVGAGARGGPRTLMGKALETYISKHPPGTKQMAARPFLRPALEDMRSQIVERLQRVLSETAQRTLNP